MRSVTGITILLTLGIMGEAKSTQPDAVESTEEAAVDLPCNHPTIGGNEYIHWYRQIPQQGPEYVIHGLKENVTKETATLAIATDRKSSTLILPQVTLRDSAVYYCILRDTQWDMWGCTCAKSPWWERKQQQHRKGSLHKKEQKPKRSKKKTENQRGKNERSQEDEKSALTLLKGQESFQETKNHSCKPAMKGKENENLP